MNMFLNKFLRDYLRTHNVDQHELARLKRAKPSSLAEMAAMLLSDSPYYVRTSSLDNGLRFVNNMGSQRQRHALSLRLIYETPRLEGGFVGDLITTPNLQALLEALKRFVDGGDPPSQELIAAAEKEEKTISGSAQAAEWLAKEDKKVAYPASWAVVWAEEDPSFTETAWAEKATATAWAGSAAVSTINPRRGAWLVRMASATKPSTSLAPGSVLAAQDAIVQDFIRKEFV